MKKIISIFCLTVFFGIIGAEKEDDAVREYDNACKRIMTAVTVLKKGESARQMLACPGFVKNQLCLNWDYNKSVGYGEALYVVDSWQKPTVENTNPGVKVVHLTSVHQEKKGKLVQQENILYPSVFNKWVAKDGELYIYGAKTLVKDYIKAGYAFFPGLKIYIMKSLEDYKAEKLALEKHVKLTKAHIELFCIHYPNTKICCCVAASFALHFIKNNIL